MSEVSLAELKQAASTSRGRRRRPPRVPRRRRAAAILVALAMVVGAAAFAYANLAPLVREWLEPTDFEGPGTGRVVVQVQPGDSGRAIGETLEEAGVVKTAGAFVSAVRDEPAAQSIQPGTYLMLAEMKASDAVETLLDASSRIALQVTVPEGLSVPDTLQRVAEGTGLDLEQLQDAAADPAALGLPPEAQGDPEGWLYPATYDFDPDVTAGDALATMVARAVQQLDEHGVPADQRRVVLTKASLVEAEARLPEDFAKVSRVFENRLANGMPLQLDSTVLYAVGETSITTTPEQRQTDSPYNTYLYPGLPPGPINSPGAAAIEAVLEPAEGSWLYFVTVNPDTGETLFADTYEEHLVNVEQFQQWLRDNPGR